MADPIVAEASAPAQLDESVYRSFHEYRFDLDKDFLGGLVLALGGNRALAQTASQADIVMHSRIFYYGRISGVTIPCAAYRHWLRRLYHAGQQARLWEWDLLEALCNHRDKLVSAGAAPPAAARGDAAAEKARWVRALLATETPSHAPPQTAAGDGDGGADVEGHDGPTPAWMAAAPKSELYVDRTLAGSDDDDVASPAYPERFAAIIKAVQTGEPIEGIVEIPDIVARNPTTTPFGSMARPLKPWEKARPAVDNTMLDDTGYNGLAAHLDENFPDDGIEAAGGRT